MFRKFKKRQKNIYTSSRKRFTDPPVSSLYVFTARIGLPSYHCVSMFIPLRSVSNRWSKYTAMIVYFSNVKSTKKNKRKSTFLYNSFHDSLKQKSQNTKIYEWKMKHRINFHKAKNLESTTINVKYLHMISQNLFFHLE